MLKHTFCIADVDLYNVLKILY